MRTAVDLAIAACAAVIGLGAIWLAAVAVMRVLTRHG